MTVIFISGGNQSTRRVPLVENKLPTIPEYLSLTELTNIGANRYPGGVLGHITIEL